MKKLIKTAVFSLCVCFIGEIALAGTIIGKIKYGGKPEKEVVLVDKEGGLANAVVYLEDVKGKFKAPDEPIVLKQLDKIFVPHVLAAMKGSTLSVNNSDPVFHNVSSNSKTKKFNVGQAKKGESSKVLLDKTGVIDVFCDVHNWMSAYVVVLDNPFFAVTNEKGLFKIDGMKPGEYTLKVWHEKLGTLESSITVPEDDKAKVILKYETGKKEKKSEGGGQ